MAGTLDLTLLSIDMLARPIQLMKAGPGVFINGHWVPGAATPIDIMAVHQATSRQDMEYLPEGLRERVTKTVWTRTTLNDADEASATAADELVIEGETYRVMRALKRTEAGFTKAYCERVRAGGRSG
jgi:hypothetical protein